MTKRLLMAIVIVMLSALLLVQLAMAMSSSHYRLDWFTPLTSGGGGTAGSTHYAVNLTLGQTAFKASASPSYNLSLGYWAGITGSFRVYLPLIMK